MEIKSNEMNANQINETNETNATNNKERKFIKINKNNEIKNTSGRQSTITLALSIASTTS